jgi:hypothetical protein
MGGRVQQMGCQCLSYTCLSTPGESYRAKESGAEERVQDTPVGGRRIAELGYVYPGHPLHGPEEEAGPHNRGITARERLGFREEPPGL